MHSARSLSVALFAAGFPWFVAAAQSVAFVDVNVIPMTRDTVIARQTVIVTGDRIASIGPHSAAQVPADATIIDGRGKFLIPGLGDAHAHLTTPGAGSSLAASALQLFALHGVSMIRSAYTEPAHHDVRAQVERREIIGPRVAIVSPAFTGQSTPTPAAAREAIARYDSAGYRVLKILPGLSLATFETITTEARRRALTLAGHVAAPLTLRGALAAPFVSLEHLDGFIEALQPEGAPPAPGGFFGIQLATTADESRISAIVAAVKQSGVTVVPTEYEMELFAGFDGGDSLRLRSEMRFVPPRLLDQWTAGRNGFMRNAGVTPQMHARYTTLRRKLIRELHAAGVPIAVGSDAFNQFAVPGAATIREIETLVASGLSPYSAMEAATTRVARLMEISNVTGTIAVGAAADLMLLDGNPLQSISMLREPAGIMIRGRWMTRREIDLALDKLAEAARR